MIPIPSSQYAEAGSMSSGSRGGAGGSGSGAHRPPLKRGDACLYCRKRRIRCSATKPSCHHCTKLKRECVYDTSKPVSRVRQLENKVAELEQSLREANAIIQAQQAAVGGALPMVPDPLGVAASASFSTGSGSIDNLGASLTPGSQMPPVGEGSPRPNTPMGHPINQFATPQHVPPFRYGHPSPSPNPSIPSSLRPPRDNSFEWENLDAAQVPLDFKGPNPGAPSVLGHHAHSLPRPLTQGSYFAHQPATMLPTGGVQHSGATDAPGPSGAGVLGQVLPISSPARARSESAVPYLPNEGYTPRILPVPDHGLAATVNSGQTHGQDAPLQHQHGQHPLAQQGQQAQSQTYAPTGTGSAAAPALQPFYAYHEEPESNVSSRDSPGASTWHSTPSSSHHHVRPQGSRPSDQSLHDTTSWYEAHQSRGARDQLSSPSPAACALDLEAALRELEYSPFAHMEQRAEPFTPTSAVIA